MVLAYTKGQRTMTAIAEVLLEQHYVHHRGRETPTPTGNSSSPNRWRRRDTTRAYLAEAEPIKELTDTATFGKEGISDVYDGEQDETEDGPRGGRRVGRSSAVGRGSYGRVATIQWQGQGQEQRQGKGQRQRQRQVER